MTKQTQIVCQHLENVSRDALEEYQDILRSSFAGGMGSMRCIGTGACTMWGWLGIFGRG
jgi:hypothetical protein